MISFITPEEKLKIYGFFDPESPPSIVIPVFEYGKCLFVQRCSRQEIVIGFDYCGEVDEQHFIKIAFEGKKHVEIGEQAITGIMISGKKVIVDQHNLIKDITRDLVLNLPGSTSPFAKLDLLQFASASSREIVKCLRQCHDLLQERGVSSAGSWLRRQRQRLELKDPLPAARDNGAEMDRATQPQWPSTYHSQIQPVYGEPLVDRHKWRHTVFLIEFLMKTNWQAEIQLAPPFSDDDPRTQDELQDLRAKRDHEGRSERADEIIAEIHDYIGLYENLCSFDAHSHPVTSGLVRTVDLIGWTVAQYYKELFGRRRPSELDPSIRPIIRVPPSPTFPGGYSTQVHLISRALENVLGDRADEPHSRSPTSSLRDELENIAQRVAENREWAGVHYRSDTEAGRTLALSIWALIERNANFARFVEQARNEWGPERAIQSGYRFLYHAPGRDE